MKGYYDERIEYRGKWNCITGYSFKPVRVFETKAYTIDVPGYHKITGIRTQVFHIGDELIKSILTSDGIYIERAIKDDQ